MSERWKYQIKKGLPFGLIMPILITAIDAYGTSFKDAFLSQRFLTMLGVFMFAGIFIIGYSYWREKQKNEMYNKN